MDIQEVGQGSLDWIDMAQDTESWQALVNVLWDLRAVLYNAGNTLTC